MFTFLLKKRHFEQLFKAKYCILKDSQLLQQTYVLFFYDK